MDEQTRKLYLQVSALWELLAVVAGGLMCALIVMACLSPSSMTADLFGASLCAGLASYCGYEAYRLHPGRIK